MGMARGRTTYEVVHPTVTVAKKMGRIIKHNLCQNHHAKVKKYDTIRTTIALTDLHFEWSDNTLSSFVLEH